MAGSPQYMRNLNENLIMDALIAMGDMSRADISRYTKLSKPTVSSAVEHLIERNLVLETGRADNAQGRKATLIRFNQAAYYVCGVDIGATQIRMALADLRGAVLDYRTYPMEANSGRDQAGTQILDLLRRYTDELLAANHLTWEQIQCIGFGIPGVVNPNSGEISRIVSPLEGMEEALEMNSLSKVFPCKIILENDVNLAALGEYTNGAAVESDLFVFMSIGAGTGAGIMVNGQLLRGMGGLTGELAEMLLKGGRRLEDMLSADGLMKLAREMQAHFPEEYDSGTAEFRKHPTPERLFEAARSGEVQAVQILEQYSHWLAMALHHICVILAPDLIVLGGGIGGNGDVLLPFLRQIRSEQFSVQPKLTCSKLGDRAVATGAVQVALQQTILHLQH
ncbi:ROK family transcriptional regulator [Paenibacillus pabuli]|uniref:ROK family transcriptional regulator n=1 Tax=Paenibacillus pabuli TaxID=1472 RepID=UPI0007838119|nr:ROK family transcriptional regulator [Paenibacillus pabuli]MEC0127359.1 ROK family transcriptional regulator [Paenibacillus pabuli]